MMYKNLHKIVNLLRRYTPQRLLCIFLLRKRLRGSTGVIQAGANSGQELSLFAACGIRKALLFEPVLSVFTELQQNALGFPPMQVQCVQKGLGSKNQKKDMFLLSNNYASSSFLQPGSHLKQYKNVQIIGKEEMEIITLDSYQPSSDLDFLYMDVQGYELEILKGSIQTLKNIRTIYLEFLVADLYTDCPSLAEIDQFLRGVGFTRIASYKVDRNHGDALYAKR